MAEPLTADEIAAETPTDRTVRLALRAGRYKTERDDARAERDDAYSLTEQIAGERDEARAAIARVEALCARMENCPDTECDHSPRHCLRVYTFAPDIRRALAGPTPTDVTKGSDRAAEPLSALARTNDPPTT